MDRRVEIISRVAEYRARFDAETGVQITKTPPNRSAFVYWLDRLFPRIVIGRRGPGQR